MAELFTNEQLENISAADRYLRYSNFEKRLAEELLAARAEVERLKAENERAPKWHDKPPVAGLYYQSSFVVQGLRIVDEREITGNRIWPPSSKWFGPIPEPPQEGESRG